MRGCQPLTDAEVVRVRDAMEGTMAVRNAALWILGTTTGLRISELLSLDIADVETEAGTLAQSLLVSKRDTKGQVAGRVCTIWPAAAEALRLWLILASSYCALRSWPLFCTPAGRRIDRYHAADILAKAMRRAGITHAVLGTHTMRKTFIHNCDMGLRARIAAGEQINHMLELQRLSGHKSLQSLGSYLDTIGEAGQKVCAAWTTRLQTALLQGSKTGGESPKMRSGVKPPSGRTVKKAVCQNTTK